MPMLAISSSQKIAVVKPGCSRKTRVSENGFGFMVTVLPERTGRNAGRGELGSLRVHSEFCWCRVRCGGRRDPHLLTRDKSRSTLIGQVRPEPVDGDCQAVTEPY